MNDIKNDIKEAAQNLYDNCEDYNDCLTYVEETVDDLHHVNDGDRDEIKGQLIKRLKILFLLKE